MNRAQLISSFEGRSDWDVIVIGGGATGLGAALDASSRGYSTVLLERHDFAKGTSSRSTKLVHGGIRYLQQGNVKLVMEALRERGILRKNAPHLVRNQSFIVPNYKWWEGSYYGLGLKVYDWMSGSLGLGKSQWLNVDEVLQMAPTLDAEGLRGGVLYHDGQFDDARLAINLAQTIIEQNGVALNYFSVTRLLKTGDKIQGVAVTDELSGKTYEVTARAIINATGVFSDNIQEMDDPHHLKSIAPSQGIHLVLDKSFLPGKAAIMIPHTDDGRVLFAVPWHNHIIVGTTDTPVSTVSDDPSPEAGEIDFLLEHASRYLTKDPTRADIKSIFTGLRPLVKTSSKRTAELSRDHTIIVSNSGLISIVGGKWTTYRKMAEDVVNVAAKNASLPAAECITSSLFIHGAHEEISASDPFYYYGSDLQDISRLLQNPDLDVPIHPDLPYLLAHIAWAIQEEMCMTVDDALSRRTRALFLDARAAIVAAPAVAAFMADLMGHDKAWQNAQLETFNKIAAQYLPR